MNEEMSKTEKSMCEIDEMLPDPSKPVQLLILLVMNVFSGLITKTLWSWFIVPIGAPAISLLNAIGIDIFISYHIPIRNDIMNRHKFWARCIHLFSVCLTFLLLASIVRLFM